MPALGFLAAVDLPVTELTSIGDSDEGIRALRNAATTSADNPAC